MFVMTTKVNLKKVLIILGIVAAVILAIVLLAGGNEKAVSTAATTISNNDARVKFLTDLGWEVTTSPKESGQVKIPEEMTQVYERYNALQKSQGYDLTQYAGKTVMRYVYEINNFPGATEPVYATLLIYKNQIIGGDITDTAAKGAIRGLKRSAEEDPIQTTPIESNPTQTPPAS